MVVQQHDKSWHFPFLIQCFLCKQPAPFLCGHMCTRTEAAHTHNGQFYYLLSNSMAANKRGKWQEICQSFIVERCLTKEALKSWQLFFFQVTKTQNAKLMKERPQKKKKTPASGPTPILTLYRWRSCSRGSTEKHFSFRDHLVKHKGSSKPVKSVLLKSKSPWTHWW